MLWSNLTGELLLAHSWRRPYGAGGPRGAPRGPSPPPRRGTRGPGNKGKGGITVWCYLGDGGRSLLQQQQQQQQQQQDLEDCMGRGAIPGAPGGSWGPTWGPPCPTILQPLLLKVGGFAERPLPRETGSSSSNSNSSGNPPTPSAADAAEGTLAATDGRGLHGGPSMSPSPYREIQRMRTSPYAVSSPDAYSPWGPPLGGPFGGAFGSRLSGALGVPEGREGGGPQLFPDEAPHYEGRETARNCCYEEKDNAVGLVQSSDGRVVAYWSLPAEIIAVWSIPPNPRGGAPGAPPPAPRRGGPFFSPSGAGFRGAPSEGPLFPWEEGEEGIL